MTSLAFVYRVVLEPRCPDAQYKTPSPARLANGQNFSEGYRPTTENNLPAIVSIRDEEQTIPIAINIKDTQGITGDDDGHNIMRDSVIQQQDGFIWSGVFSLVCLHYFLHIK